MLQQFMSYLYFTPTPVTSVVSSAKSSPGVLLTEDEQFCYNRIVHDLMHSSFANKRVEQKIIAPEKITRKPMYSIEFRQSESWDLVDEMFLRVVTKDKAVHDWSKKWQERISSLRGAHVRKFNIGKELHDFKNADNKLETDKRRALLTLTNRRIINILQEAKKEISPINFTFPLDVQCRQIINFLNTRWNNLILFSEWPEISMAERKMVVRVIGPYQNIINKKCDGSLEGFFIIEEKKVDIEEKEIAHYVGTEVSKYTIFNTKKIGLKTEDSPMQTPNSLRRTRSASPMQTPDTIRRSKSARALVNDLPKAIKNDLLYSNYSFTTESTSAFDNSPDPRLQNIVKLAIDNVNKKLKIDRPLLNSK